MVSSEWRMARANSEWRIANRTADNPLVRLSSPTRHSLSSKVALMANVTLRDVSKTYPGGFEAIKGINFEVDDGRFCVLVGPSGRGKGTPFAVAAGVGGRSARRVATAG